MTQKEFRRNCKCYRSECKYLYLERTSAGDDVSRCQKLDEIIEDYKSGKDKCRYSK